MGGEEKNGGVIDPVLVEQVARGEEAGCRGDVETQQPPLGVVTESDGGRFDAHFQVIFDILVGGGGAVAIVVVVLINRCMALLLMWCFCCFCFFCWFCCWFNYFSHGCLCGFVDLVMVNMVLWGMWLFISKAV